MWSHQNDEMEQESDNRGEPGTCADTKESQNISLGRSVPQCANAAGMLGDKLFAETTRKRRTVGSSGIGF